jgi:hypothetical protein
MIITSKAYWVFLGGAVCLILGMGGSILGIALLQIALRFSRVPQAISYADLIAHGPGENVHIGLTDFTPRWDGAFYLRGKGDILSQVYLPIGPADRGKALTGREIGAILVVQDIHDQKEFNRLYDSTRFTGIVKSFGALSHYSELRRYNPGIVPAQCWQIDGGYEPWSVNASFWTMISSIFAFVLGSFLYVNVAALYSSMDQRTQGVMVAHSPLLLVVGALQHWCRRGLPASAWAKGILFMVIGLSLLALGGVQIYQFLFISHPGLNVAMMLGALSLDVGFALFAGGVFCMLREKEEPASDSSAGASVSGIVADDSPTAGGQSRFYRRYFAWGAIGLGAGLFFTALQKHQQEDDNSIGMPVMIGIAVTAGLVGVVLLVAPRKSSE